MKTIPVSKVSNIRMAAGGEKRITKLIDDGVLKEWVGIGWIVLRKATAADKKRYMRVAR